MAAQTDFRPQLHGFDFDNNWDTDDNYRSFIRAKVHDALPIAAKAIATNPAIGAALVGALGAVAGIGEALLPGLFETIAIPIIVNEIINAINDKIDNGLPDSYGACGGMAFAPLDYYYQQWVIPKGIFAKVIGKNTFEVPPNDNPNAAILRNYIYKRFEDTWDAGGVLNKMLQWYVILKTIPAQFGGGGPEVQSRCKQEWTTLAALLDQGKPQPIALLFDSWNIFDNHQVVAYGYGGDPASGPASINIYDNNHPDQEVLIKFDFQSSEMQGTLTDINGIVLTKTDDKGKITPYYDALKGFFWTIYTLQAPPPSWAVQQSLSATPSICQSVKAAFNLAATVQNAFTFFEQPDQATTLTPVASDILSMNVIPTSYQSVPGVEAYRNVNPTFAGTTSYNYPGDYWVQMKAYLQVFDSAGHLVSDQFNQPLTRLMSLPAISTQVSASLRLQVLPALMIGPVNRTGDSCFFPFVEGGSVILGLKVQPFPGADVSYLWTTSSPQTGSLTAAQLEIFNLPPANTTFEVSVKVVNLTSGCIATGSQIFSTYDGVTAGHLYGVCQIRKIFSEYLKPGLINPWGPDDPELTRFIERNLGAIREDAKKLLELTSKLSVLKNSVIIP